VYELFFLTNRIDFCQYILLEFADVGDFSYLQIASAGDVAKPHQLCPQAPRQAPQMRHLAHRQLRGVGAKGMPHSLQGKCVFIP
jgi:hypothetical protein